MPCPPCMLPLEAGGTEVHHTFDIGGNSHAIWLSRSAEEYRLTLAAGRRAVVAFVQTGGGEGSLTVDGSSEPLPYSVEGDTDYIHLRCTAYAVRYGGPLGALAVEA